MKSYPIKALTWVGIISLLSACAGKESAANRFHPREPAPEKIALKLETYIGHNGVSEALGGQENAKRIFDRALNLVALFGPAGQDNYFEWNGNRSPLRDKSLAVFFLDGTRPSPDLGLIDNELAIPVRPADQDVATALDGEGLIILGTDANTRKPKIVVIVLVDQIFIDNSKGDEPLRRDGFTRLVTVLGRVFYGYLNYFLSLETGSKIPPVAKLRWQMEGEGFRGGTGFLERVVESRMFERSDSLGRDLETALGRERAALDKWQQGGEPISDPKR
jgi:hypothetical protein